MSIKVTYFCSVKIDGHIRWNRIEDPYFLLSPATRASIPEPSLDALLNGLSASISEVFAWGLIPAVFAVVAACMMRREKHDPKAEMEAMAAAAH
ncbi:hypothetical protein [Cohnella luojiensis]|uniref:Uncharacterized protein n=1 Tax=Cohnella luojiensis TaxID=652876 RepID=A0A4Y8LQS6_9BACL|nr:hypothetical protein [Cohnella luojiensis]TFE23744.1 hypothetical protein E2980_18085 [Cohnella luojiensis]